MIKYKKNTSKKKRYKCKRYSKRDEDANHVTRTTAMGIEGKCNITHNLEF